jgi:hypothetical protein
MAREAEIVVGTRHDEPLAADDHLGVLGGLYSTKNVVVTGGLGFIRLGKVIALGKYIHYPYSLITNLYLDTTEE